MKMFRPVFIILEGFDLSDLFPNKTRLKVKSRKEPEFRDLGFLPTLIIYLLHKFPRTERVRGQQLGSIGMPGTKGQ